MSRRAVITGLGVVTAYGVGLEALWAGLSSGRSALGPVKLFDASGFACSAGGEAEGVSAKDAVPKTYRKFVKVMARDTELAVVAAGLAVEDAGLTTRAGEGEPTYAPGRMGCHIGAGLMATELKELTSALATAIGEDGQFGLDAWGSKGINNLQPLWLLKYLPNMLACHVTILHGCEGPSNTLTDAEASGLLSLGESARVIQRGDAEVCFSGGAESKLNPMGVLRMTRAGRLAETNGADPASLVRPYDAGATGQLLGEGGGILIVEEAEAAAARGAKVYAEILGFGAGQSGRGLDSLTLEGEAPEVDDGLVGAIERALGEAGCGADEIDAIVPHAAGHVWMDSGEAGALREVFGERLGSVPLVTLTPGIGECMAGAGGVQAVVAAACLARGRLPGRIHAGSPTDGLDAGAAPERELSLKRVLVCTTSLGGASAAIVLGRSG
ncbi:MAG: hypothetical protein EA423_00765 [Phycisphaerales bacterium]|nr:MAG: hypothetical protein EA423_00765 [Phycisphaerales bacterium]